MITTLARSRSPLLRPAPPRKPHGGHADERRGFARHNLKTKPLGACPDWYMVGHVDVYSRVMGHVVVAVSIIVQGVVDILGDRERETAEIKKRLAFVNSAE